MSQNFEQLFQKYQARKEEDESIDDIIADLHAEGLWIIDSIKMIRKLYQISLREAKLVVSAHPVWNDVVKASEPLHDMLEEALLREVTRSEGSADGQRDGDGSQSHN